MFFTRPHYLFSNLGRVYRIKAYEIPEGSRTAKGMNLVNIVPLMPNEKITVIIPVTADDEDERYICMITRKGIVKRTKLSDFKNTRKTVLLLFLSMTAMNSPMFV